MDPMPAEQPPAVAPAAEGGAPPAGGMPEVAAPPAPPEGYSERCVRDLVKAVGLAMKAATKAMGRDAPEIPEPPKTLFQKGVMHQGLPAFMVQEIAMLLAVAAKIGGKQEGRYEVDLAEMLANSDGLERLATLLELFAKDKVLLAGLKEAQKAGPQPAGPSAEEQSPAHEAAEPPQKEAAEEMGAKQYM